MRFTEQFPPTDAAADRSADEDPAVMRIGGPRGRRLRAAAGWAVGVAGVGGLLVAAFVWFGATVGWAVALVGLMLAYMAAMAKWAGWAP